MTAPQYAGAAVRFVERAGRDRGRIGIESRFLPIDAYRAIEAGFPACSDRRRHVHLGDPRAIKTPRQLAALSLASEKVVDAFIAVFASHGPGSKKREIVQDVKREEETRGLKFEYCLCNMGQCFNRAPSDQVWRDGDVLALNSGGNYNGYIGDLCRMGVLGRPDSELEDLLAEVGQFSRQRGGRSELERGSRHLRGARHADRPVTAPSAPGLRGPRNGHRQPRSAVAHG